MTVFQEIDGYGEVPYGSIPYGAELVHGSTGVQWEVKIVENPKPTGVEWTISVPDIAVPQGSEWFATNLGVDCDGGYGTVPYGSIGYGLSACSWSSATEWHITINDFAASQGVEWEVQIADVANPNGIEWVSQIVDQANSNGVEWASKILDFPNPEGVQYESQIVDFANPNGLEYESKIVDHPHAEGVEWQVVTSKPVGVEWRVALYNATQFRYLCIFDNRGVEAGAGNNAWGNPVASGQTWKTNSQDPSADYTVQNLNTDITEQTYRTAATTGITLDLDMESNPGSFVDTIGIMNHNMTSGATITLIGSADSLFGTIGITIGLTPRIDNIFWISPLLPLTAFRYWRFQIDDFANTNPYVEIGGILMGASTIFTVDECMLDRVLKRRQSFVDTVKTEGFTSVKNDRSLKNFITLTFSSLRWSKGNWQGLDSLFQTARTSQKCLYIPTPSVTRPSQTERFAIFGKLPRIPEEEHNVKGTPTEDLDFISVTLDIDEAE